jgi:hypothetical protein
MDIVPPKKPFTEDQFKYNTDRRIKGALGGFDKSMMIELIQKDLMKIEESGVMDYDDAISFIQERSKELKEFIKENPGETLPPLKGFEDREDFNYGGTKKTILVKKLFEAAGGEEGTGKTLEEFMADVLFEGDYLDRKAEGGRIGFDNGSDLPTMTNEDFITERTAKTDMNNKEFADYMNTKYKPKKTEKFSTDLIDRKLRKAQQKGEIPKDFPYKGSKAERALTPEKYKNMIGAEEYEKLKNDPVKLKNKYEYEQKKKDSEFLKKKSTRQTIRNQKLKKENPELYDEKILEPQRQRNYDKRKDGPKFVFDRKNAEATAWKDLVSRTHERNKIGKDTFFTFKEPIEEGKTYRAEDMKKIVLVDQDGNEYKRSSLFEDVKKYRGSNEAKLFQNTYDQRAFLTKQGLTTELNKLYGFRPGGRQSVFHVHHFLGFDRNPFRVHLTFGDQNVAEGKLKQTYDADFARASALPQDTKEQREKRFGAMKKAVKSYYKSIGPDILAQLGKNPKGANRTLLELLEKTGVDLKTDQDRFQKIKDMSTRTASSIKSKMDSIRPFTSRFPGGSIALAPTDFAMSMLSGAPVYDAAASAGSYLAKDPLIGKAVNVPLALREITSYGDEKEMLQKATERREGLESMLSSIPSKFSDTIKKFKDGN